MYCTHTSGWCSSHQTLYNEITLVRSVRACEIPFSRRSGLAVRSRNRIIRMNKKAFVVLVGGMFISMLGMGIMTPFLPIYARDLGASSLQIGMVQSMFRSSRADRMPP